MRTLIAALAVLTVCTAAMAAGSATNFVVLSGGPQSYWGIDPYSPTGGDPGTSGNYYNVITAAADVPLYFNDAMDQVHAQFNFGKLDAAATVDAVFNGHLLTNYNCYQQIMCTDNPATDLTKLKSGANSMDCVWAFKWDLPGKDWETLTPSGHFLNTSTTGSGVDCDYHLKLSVTAARGQAEGTYILDPAMSVKPAL